MKTFKLNVCAHCVLGIAGIAAMLGCSDQSAGVAIDDNTFIAENSSSSEIPESSSSEEQISSSSVELLSSSSVGLASSSSEILISSSSAELVSSSSDISSSSSFVYVPCKAAPISEDFLYVQEDEFRNDYVNPLGIIIKERVEVLKAAGLNDSMAVDSAKSEFFVAVGVDTLLAQNDTIPDDYVGYVIGDHSGLEFYEKIGKDLAEDGNLNKQDFCKIFDSYVNGYAWPFEDWASAYTNCGYYPDFYYKNKVKVAEAMWKKCSE